MAIALTRAQIDQALPRIAPGLERYLWLQGQLRVRNLRTDADFRRRFNYFYRVRRAKDWQKTFYGLLESKKFQVSVGFAEVLHALHEASGRYEASFASKLVATLRPEMPVIDSIVLWNLNLALPRYNATGRAARIVRLHETLVSRFSAFLATHTGRYLLKRFHEEYPSANISEVKMLDLVLWQTRPNKLRDRTRGHVARSRR